MNGLRKTLLATGLAVLGTTAAHAADLYQPPVIEPLPVEQFGGGWYLRGYVGMSNQKVEDTYNPVYETTNDLVTLQSDFDSAPFLGGAIGYQVNDWVRVEGSAEYRGKASYHGLQRYTNLGPDDIYGTADDFTADDDYSATKSEWLVLANAFVDLGSWYGISPFVGAGIGASYNSIDNFRDVSVSVPGGSVGYADADPSWNLAWALYAGVGYEVTPNLTMELGYRYADLGEGKTTDVLALDGTSSVINPWTFEDITSHDVFLGFRYLM